MSLAQPLIELRGGRGDRRPVEAGLAVGAHLARAEPADGVQLEPSRVDAGDPVAPQHGVGVRVDPVPRVGGIRVHGMVLREPAQGPHAQRRERHVERGEAACQLPAGIGVEGAARELVAVLGDLRRPGAPRKRSRPGCRVVVVPAPERRRQVGVHLHSFACQGTQAPATTGVRREVATAWAGYRTPGRRSPSPTRSAVLEGGTAAPRAFGAHRRGRGAGSTMLGECDSEPRPGHCCAAVPALAGAERRPAQPAVVCSWCAPEPWAIGVRAGQLASALTRGVVEACAHQGSAIGMAREAERSGRDQPEALRDERGLRAVGDAELAQDVRGMDRGSPFADGELRGDLAIRLAGGHQLEYLSLTGRESSTIERGVLVAVVVARGPGRRAPRLMLLAGVRGRERIDVVREQVARRDERRDDVPVVVDLGDPHVGAELRLAHRDPHGGADGRGAFGVGAEDAGVVGVEGDGIELAPRAGVM
jgi:hypothetical protein